MEEELSNISTHNHDGSNSQKISSYNVIPTLRLTTVALNDYLSRNAIDGEEFNVYITDSGEYRKYLRVNDDWLIIDCSSVIDYFGNGADGDVIISTNTSLNSDKYYSNLTIEDGITLNPSGYRIFVGNTTKFIGTGKIARNGNNGGTEEDIKIGGAALADGTIKGALAGGAGGSGGEYSGGGSNGYPGTAGANSALSLLNTSGKAGGKGGDSKLNPGDTPNSGGAGGTGGVSSSTENVEFATKELLKLTTLTLDSENQQSTNNLSIVKGVTSGETLSLTAASGGGGGGATLFNEAVGGNGGGAGGNGGIVYLASAHIITVDGNNFIEAKGGNGHDGADGLSTVPIKDGGGGGGGAGGQGGLAIVIYKSLVGGGTISVAGGAGGTGGTGAINNIATNPDGEDGQNGNNGKYIKVKIS